METANGFGSRVGGRPCLDFVNTVRGRISRPHQRGRDFADQIVGERLGSYEALLRWSTFAGVLTRREARDLAREAAASPAQAASVLARAVVVREALYRVFKSAVEGWSPPADDLATINREVQQARGHERLVATPTFHWEWHDAVALDRVLWPVVRSAADLLTASELERVKQCPGDTCGWLFLDTSRSGRRQWCDMADCGNVAKVRRFREKQRGLLTRARRHAGESSSSGTSS